MKTANIASGFGALNLSPRALENLKALGIHTPTPIQEQSIPFALEGKDLFGIAQTGTGKTLAFALPIFEHLEPGKSALILAPTRELAEQIERTFWDLEFRTALLIGGAAMDRQVGWLRKKPPIIIATPGRLLDHLERRSANLKNVSIVVLDEADRMLDIGFAPAIRKIMEQCPEERQTMLFSATLSDDIEGIALRHMKSPVRIEIARQGTTAENVEQSLVVCEHESKHDVLKELMYENAGSMLVFTRTRHGARKIAKFTRDLGHRAVEIHSDRTLGQRREALEGFRSGRYRIMVATDVAARGIDVKEISMVVNFDVPEHAEDYVHRIGRTGRAGASGKAVTFVIPQQWKEVRDIEKLISMQIPDSPHTMLPLKRAAEGGGRSRSSRNLSQRNKVKQHSNQPFEARQDRASEPNAEFRTDSAPEAVQESRPVERQSFRSDSRGNGRNQNRPDHRNDSRPPFRPSSRPESRPESRPDNRSDYRRDDRPDDRRDNRNESNPAPRQENRADARPDFRSDRRDRPAPHSDRPQPVRREENRGYDSNDQKPTWKKSDFRPTPRPLSDRNPRPGDAPPRKKEGGGTGDFTKKFDQKPEGEAPKRRFNGNGSKFAGKKSPPSKFTKKR